MAQHDVSKELEILQGHGYTYEELKSKFDLYEHYACNRNNERRIKHMVSEVQQKAKKAQLKAARRGDARAFTEPFFTRHGDEWAVVARGIDFITDGYGGPVVKVRRRDGSVSTVEVIEMVDRSSEKVRTWTIQ